MSKNFGDRLIVAFPFVGDSVGGSHISALALIVGLNQTGLKPLVILHRLGVLSEFFDERGIDYRIAPKTRFLSRGRDLIKHPLSLVAGLWRLRGIIRENRVSLVHGNDGRINQTWSIAARLANIPFIWHQRTVFAPSRITEVCIRLAKRVVCISEFTRSRLPTEAQSNAIVLKNPIDTDGVIEHTGASGVVGFIGTITPQKRPEVFLQAAARVRRQLGTSVKFILIGRDRNGYVASMEALVRQLNLEDAVEFAGFRYPVYPDLARFEVLAAPQVEDGFGRALVEAMAAGVPVVASASGGHTEIIDDGRNGLLVPSDDADELANKIILVLKNPDMARSLSENARSVPDRFSVALHTEEMVQVYRSVLVP